MVDSPQALSTRVPEGPPTREVTPEDLDEYLSNLLAVGHQGLERGRAVRVLRKVSTPDLREKAQLLATSLLLPVSRRRARRLQDKGGPLRLNLGSGPESKPGWINVDLIGMHPTLPWNLQHGLPFPPSSVDAVFAEHVFEHFPAADGFHLLVKVHEMLRPGGTVRVAVPDFGRYMTSYVEHDDFIERTRPGRPTSLLAVAEVITCHGHRSAWDGETLVTLLRAAGFVDCATRPHGVSGLQPAPDTPARKLESVYAEGVKASS